VRKDHYILRISIVWKMTLAFLLVALITAALVAVFIRLTSVDRLSSLIVDQQRSTLHAALLKYYEENGTWDGVVDDWWQMRRLQLPTDAVRPDDHMQPPPRERQEFFGLADAQGLIVVAYGSGNPTGSVASADAIMRGTSITVNGKLVGTILNAPLRPSFNPEENRFLQRTTEALLYAVFGAILLALLMGIVLARTLTRPLQDLTNAAQNIAQGKLEQQVQVRSNDELGRLAAAFNQMSQEVARVNQLRRQMTADIAHDLRTPLQVIAGYIESMRDGVLRPTPERLALIYTEIEHLQHLVNDLRMLSQVDAGELPLHPLPIPPQMLLQRVAATFMHRAEIQQVALTVMAGDGLPDIYVDEDRMMQVFGNLLTNALRYTPAGGQIRLAAQSFNGDVLLSVSDTGSGIPAEELPYIFDRFYRVDKARTESGEIGLGLAIVRALVEAHHGAVWAESRIGESTTFSMRLPVKRSE
jgi:two-component system, OmpR family, sensor histidine kinase BaeS